MTRDDADQICWIFGLTYRPDESGVLRDKTGRAAPARSLEILDEALAVIGGE